MKSEQLLHVATPTTTMRFRWPPLSENGDDRLKLVLYCVSVFYTVFISKCLWVVVFNIISPIESIYKMQSHILILFILLSSSNHFKKCFKSISGFQNFYIYLSDKIVCFFYYTLYKIMPFFALLPLFLWFLNKVGLNNDLKRPQFSKFLYLSDRIVSFFYYTQYKTSIGSMLIFLHCCHCFCSF